MNTDSEKTVTEVSRLESERAGLGKAYVCSSQVFPTSLHLPQKCNGSFSGLFTSLALFGFAKSSKKLNSWAGGTAVCVLSDSCLPSSLGYGLICKER